jgi:hypothetical protein
LTPKADNFGAREDVFNKKRVGDITHGELSNLIVEGADKAATCIGLEVSATMLGGRWAVKGRSK